VWELDALFDGSPHRTFNDALRAFGREHRDLASGLRGQRYRSLRELSKLGYGGLPDIPVHWDFHHDNILTAGGAIIGLLDFDSAHLDARVADIAFSISLDCREPPDHNAVNPAAVRAFVGGYVEHTPLSGQELRLLVPLMRAAYILGAALRLAYWEQFRADAARSIARSVRFRFPLHDERAAQLEAAVYDAATNNG
jgi:Ser/Thr protein kinase RdoA (MazF antagonist)